MALALSKVLSVQIIDKQHMHAERNDSPSQLTIPNHVSIQGVEGRPKGKGDSEQAEKRSAESEQVLMRGTEYSMT